MTNGRVNPAQRNWNIRASPGWGNVYYNYDRARPGRSCGHPRRGRLGKGGAFLCSTGQFTGRSPKDKFVVRTPSVEKTIWWENNAAMAPDAFDRLYADMLAHMQGREYFVQDLFGRGRPGASP
jgi:phosphoenolpyruvate carboxykinase (ATP)